MEENNRKSHTEVVHDCTLVWRHRNCWRLSRMPKAGLQQVYFMCLLFYINENKQLLTFGPLKTSTIFSF